jgi:hypothetical protein
MVTGNSAVGMRVENDEPETPVARGRRNAVCATFVGCEAD